jgi:hypothetical protein
MISPLDEQLSTERSMLPLGAGARTACLERARLREDNDLHCEAWVLVTQATDTLCRKGLKAKPAPRTLDHKTMLEPFSTNSPLTEKSQEEEMNLEQRLDLVTRGTVEIIQPAELQRVLEEKNKPRAYWGFECSGKQF